VKTCVLGLTSGKINIFIKIQEYNTKEDLLMEFIINYRMLLLFKLYLSMKKAIITCISTSYQSQFSEGVIVYPSVAFILNHLSIITKLDVKIWVH